MVKGDLEKKSSLLKVTEKKNPSSTVFPIVGIGASAGGLEALEQFFKSVPEDCGIAFVVIQHLDPDHVGIMPELLQRVSKMKVVQVTDNLKVLPNHVFVIPPNKTMSILNGHLHLFEPIEVRGLRLPIDYFFRSLADDQHEKSIGIILSGMGSDGSIGLKKIKEKDGFALVQKPSNSKFEGMPQSAINAVNIDVVASADELPEKLIALLKINPTSAIKPNIDTKNKSNLEKVILLLRAQTGHDFSLYKKNTLYRRIERRMQIHQVDKIANYARLLQQNPNELNILFKELLIGVTNFFRDAEVWGKLKNTILPDLFNTLPDGYVLRAWISGCSTGEEAYSLAIVFREAYEKIKGDKSLSLQIFATDIDSDAIEKARKGFFDHSVTADISPTRIKQFFTKEGHGYFVNTSIREMIVFAPHSVIKDPPFTKLDLLFCRNLLIYLEPELQIKLMNLFYYSLNTDGLMILGSAENDNSRIHQFDPIDTKLKFYKPAKTTVKKELLDFPKAFTHIKQQVVDQIKPSNMTDNIQTLADQIILQNFSPASVLINGLGDILYITGRTGKYLEPAAGKANWNIYAMAREGLNNELLAAVRKAKQTYEPIQLTNVKVGTNGGTQIVDITLQNIDKPEMIKGTIIIVFSDVIDSPRITNKKSARENKNLSLREQELELQLQLAHEEIQSTREEMQTTQEELKSTNEEMQSTNEELQSTNEELTTSKEEMQSLNEELQTVNNELQSKIADFLTAESDMKNLLNSTDIGTLFLDKKLNIRRFTKELTKIFKLRPIDIGRPFTEMVSDMNYLDIEEDCNNVLQTLVYKETDISTKDKRWFTVRIMPYRTADDRIDGLVVTFINITIAKQLEEELKQSIEILKEQKLKMP